jgi:5'-phosphate synthase pdxT subunit
MDKESPPVETRSGNLPEIPPLQDDAPLIIGVLALQGAFKEHLVHLRRLQTVRPLTSIAVRTATELVQCHALIIPGGESTSISLIASRQIDASNYSFLDWLKSFAKNRSVWGTCAGLILLSDQLVSEGTKTGGQEVLGGLPIKTTRNQWGRQVECTF